MHSQDDLNFSKRMRELVEDGYIVFSKFGRWRVTEKGLTCLIACAAAGKSDRPPRARLKAPVQIRTTSVSLYYPFARRAALVASS